MLDAGYATTAPFIMASIAKLGFDIKDVKVLLNARRWGRYRKFVERDTAKNPVEPFIDPEGYQACIDAAEARFARGALH